MTVTWTKEFYGVQHLGEYGSGKHWFTVAKYGEWGELSHHFPGCGFSPKKSTHDSVDIAKQEAERLYKEYETYTL